MFELSLKNLSHDRLDEGAAFYAENGYLILTDTEDALLPTLEVVLSDILSSMGYDLADAVDSSLPLAAFTEEQRKTLSQIDTSQDLQFKLVRLLEPVLLRLLGPLIHVSSNFHAQFKGGDLMAPPVDHGGYPDDTDFLELFGQYLLHQDFTGARLPTSPGGMTCWVPLTTGENWGLRLYPGSHRCGIMCNDWMQLDDDRLKILGAPVDVNAERGRALLFHSLILHSSVNPGPARRVSIDVRFFPLCAYLPSTIWALGENPEASLTPQPGDGDTLAASRYEAQVYLGRDTGLGEVEERSVLNWVKCIEAIVKNDREEALRHLERFTNPELTGERYEIYRDKYLAQPIIADTMERARRAIRGNEQKETGCRKY